MWLYTLLVDLKERQKALVFWTIDFAIFPICFIVATALTGLPIWWEFPWAFTGALTIGAGLLSAVIGIPLIRLNAFDGIGNRRVLGLVLLTFCLGFTLSQVFPDQIDPKTLSILPFVHLVALNLSRTALLWTVRRIYQMGNARLRILIYGTGKTGQQFAAALRADNTVDFAGFIDANPRLSRTRVLGARVFPAAKLPELIAKHPKTRIVLAMPGTLPSKLSVIAAQIRNLGGDVHALPSLADLMSGSAEISHTRPVVIADLLGRDGLTNCLPAIGTTYQGQTALVTGAGGTIGSELCRQLIAGGIRRLILFDHSEYALYTVEQTLRQGSKNTILTAVLGSVCDEKLCDHLLQTHRPDIVLHAAAYKHVPLVEDNPIAGLRNNVLGTQVIANAAMRHRTPKFILISSDKAVRPTNVMGASKRLAEGVVQDLSNRTPHTLFSLVRFGNVLGSSGSVVPLFAKQIAEGGPVTVTHPKVSRYFMTAEEATRLVLLAGGFARGGDLFVLDMGPSVPIVDLAKRMIEQAGGSLCSKQNPDGDIRIAFTGLRPGEKLHEELLISPEMLPTPHPKILRAQEKQLSKIEVAAALKALQQAIDAQDIYAARCVIMRWVENDKIRLPETPYLNTA